MLQNCRAFYSSLRDTSVDSTNPRITRQQKSVSSLFRSLRIAPWSASTVLDDSQLTDSGPLAQSETRIGFRAQDLVNTLENYQVSIPDGYSQPSQPYSLGR